MFKLVLVVRPLLVVMLQHSVLGMIVTIVVHVVNASGVVTRLTFPPEPIAFRNHCAVSAICRPI